MLNNDVAIGGRRSLACLFKCHPAKFLVDEEAARRAGSTNLGNDLAWRLLAQSTQLLRYPREDKQVVLEKIESSIGRASFE